MTAGKPSPPPIYHLRPIIQPTCRQLRSPGVLGGTGASFLAPPDGAWGKGRVQQNHQHEWVFQAQCNLLVNVPLAQQASRSNRVESRFLRWRISPRWMRFRQVTSANEPCP